MHSLLFKCFKHWRQSPHEQSGWKLLTTTFPSMTGLSKEEFIQNSSGDRCSSITSIFIHLILILKP